MSIEMVSNQWVIRTDIGGKSYLESIKNKGKSSVAVWCANLAKARVFTDIGDMAQYFAAIPACFQAYEEDLDTAERNSWNMEQGEEND